MQARYNATLVRMNICNSEAVQAVRGDCLDMLRLSRGDNQGVRWQVPALLFRLGRAQKASDHRKWWATIAELPGYNAQDTNEPFLSPMDEDVLEDPETLMTISRVLVSK